MPDMCILHLILLFRSGILLTNTHTSTYPQTHTMTNSSQHRRRCTT